MECFCNLEVKRFREAKRNLKMRQKSENFVFDLLASLYLLHFTDYGVSITFRFLFTRFAFNLLMHNKNRTQFGFLQRSNMQKVDVVVV